MELEQLRTFVAVAELGTSLAAAEKLHTSQSSVSRSLRKLESELGCELFERTKNHMEPNDDGRWVLARAKAVLREADELKRGLRDRHLAERVVRVGSCAPAPLWRLMPLLAEWDPDAVAAPENLEPNEIAKRIADGTLDLGIWPGSDIPEGAVGIPLMDERLQVALPGDHPLAGRGAISMAELDGETFILYAGIGIWKEAHQTLAPHAHYVLIDDFVTFTQVSRTSPLPRFTTRETDPANTPEGFSVLDLTDDLARIDFHLIAPEGDLRWQRMFPWMERRLSVL